MFLYTHSIEYRIKWFERSSARDQIEQMIEKVKSRVRMHWIKQALYQRGDFLQQSDKMTVEFTVTCMRIRWLRCLKPWENFEYLEQLNDKKNQIQYIITGAASGSRFHALCEKK